MTSRVIKSFAVVPTVISASLVFFGTGCGGESAPTPTPTPAPAASDGGGDAKPKATAAKSKTKGVVSEDDTPARRKDKD